MNFTHLLFDLDGTLIDSKRGIFNAVHYTLDKMCIPEEDRPVDLNPFIGPPLRDSFKLLFQMSEESSETATKIYREYYSKTGLYEYDVYEGISESLNTLAKIGFSISVVTSKAEVYAKLIVESLNFKDCISIVSGCELDGRRSEKKELINYTLNRIKIKPSKKILMIGDRYHDIRGARLAGISSAAVLYGYGSQSELQNESPNLFISTPSELAFLNKK